jgi:hypothetical protein
MPGSSWQLAISRKTIYRNGRKGRKGKSIWYLYLAASFSQYRHFKKSWFFQASLIPNT